MRFFAPLLIASSLPAAALAAPHASSVGEISVRRAVATGFLAGSQVGQGQSTFLLFRVIRLIPIESRFGFAARHLV